MNEERSSVKGLLVFLIIAAFIGGLLFGRKGGELNEIIKYQTDTLVVVDTLVMKEPVYITKTKIVKDTVMFPVLEHDRDTVFVEVPIEYSHAEYSDADIYYHGFRAGIDSIKVYPKTVYIDRPYEIKKPEKSRWSIVVSGGYGANSSGLSPYFGIGIGYDLIQFNKK